MSESLIGRTLGKYQILEKLGQGGMGMVFRALQPSLNRTVAIKVLPGQLAMDPEFVLRFRQEAQVIASLQHESIVHVYDIDEADLAHGEKLYFIVMELVEGQTLREWAGRGQALPFEEVRRVGATLARALDYAHQRGIVHRDIKAANVMVTRDAKVKLMDFGIAKSVGGVRTMTGSILGTPEYMAPEQARSGKVTSQSDIYSLGVLLFEMATGQLPFSGGDAFAVALQHLSKEPPRPREVNASVPEWLEVLILRAMAKEPEDRFATAGELEAALLSGGGESAMLPPTQADPFAATLATGTPPPGWPSTPPPSTPPPSTLPPLPPPVPPSPPAPTPAPWPPATGPITASRRAGGKSGLLIGLLILLLAGVGIVIGAFWSRPGKVEINPQEVVQPGFDPANPPPLPDSAGTAESQTEPEKPSPQLTEHPPAAPPPPRAEPIATPEAEPAVKAEPAGPSAGELWSQAYRLKEEKQYHSLRDVLDRLLAKDADYGQAREWRRKVDGWIADREKDLRGEADDLIDDLVDALKDKDESNLAELWGGYDPTTEATARELWSLGSKLKWSIQIRTFKPRDDRADFDAVITVTEKGKKVREHSWRGAMADDDQGTRFTVPLR